MIELPKLKDATEEEKKTSLYRWSCLFACESWEEYDKVAKGDVSMEAAVEELKEIGNSPEEIRAYNNRMLALSDIATQTHAAERAGEKQGETKLAKLMQLLFRDGRLQEAEKAASDETERERLYQEYGID